MALIKWDESLSVGVQEIDNQHKKLVEIINELHDAMKEGKGRKLLGDIIKRMEEYTVYHFGTEEKHFVEFHYEQAESHKAEHRGFIAKVEDFQKRFSESNIELTIEVMNFLKDWLLNHIKVSDKKFTKCFNEHGLN